MHIGPRSWRRQVSPNSRTHRQQPAISYATDVESSDHSSKCSSVRKMSKRQSMDGQMECGSHRSCSREKILDTKIEHMLREQQHKLLTVAAHANKIQFAPQPTPIQGRKSRNRIENELLQDLVEQNKENTYNTNKAIQKLLFNQTQKSNKLSLRQYLNCSEENNPKQNTPDSNKLNMIKGQSAGCMVGEKSDQVLHQVRELKEMFVELMHTKTRRKTAHFGKEWSNSSKQIYTLP